MVPVELAETPIREDVATQAGGSPLDEIPHFSGEESTMPRPTETATSKLFKLIDELTPDEIRFAKEILNHADKRNNDSDPPKKRGRRRKAETAETAE